MNYSFVELVELTTAINVFILPVWYLFIFIWLVNATYTSIQSCQFMRSQLSMFLFNLPGWVWVGVMNQSDEHS